MRCIFFTQTFSTSCKTGKICSIHPFSFLNPPCSSPTRSSVFLLMQRITIQPYSLPTILRHSSYFFTVISILFSCLYTAKNNFFHSVIRIMTTFPSCCYVKIILTLQISGSVAIRLRKRVIAALPSSKPSSIFTSRICAPFSTL